MDKVILSLTNFVAEMEREKARQRTYDAMLRKARALGKFDTVTERIYSRIRY